MLLEMGPTAVRMQVVAKPSVTQCSNLSKMLQDPTLYHAGEALASSLHTSLCTTFTMTVIASRL